MKSGKKHMQSKNLANGGKHSHDPFRYGVSSHGSDLKTATQFVDGLIVLVEFEIQTFSVRATESAPLVDGVGITADNQSFAEV